MKLTVITINFNNKEGLARTFESLFSQTNSEFEYIVIDGGSNDGSKELIEKNTDRITHWVSEPDNGIYNAMNKGIKKANGDYIMFLNSGDELHSGDFLEKMSKIKSPKEIIYGDLNLVLNELQEIKLLPKELPFSFLFNDSLPHPGTLISRNLFMRVGLYDEDLKIVSDWKWFLKAIYKYNASYLHSGLISANFYLDGLSSAKEQRKNLLKERSEVLEAEFPAFVEDYRKLNMQSVLLSQRRFKYLMEIEKSKIARKITTLILYPLKLIKL